MIVQTVLNYILVIIIETVDSSNAHYFDGHFKSNGFLRDRLNFTGHHVETRQINFRTSDYVGPETSLPLRKKPEF